MNSTVCNPTRVHHDCIFVRQGTDNFPGSFGSINILRQSHRSNEIHGHIFCQFSWRNLDDALPEIVIVWPPMNSTIQSMRMSLPKVKTNLSIFAATTGATQTIIPNSITLNGRSKLLKFHCVIETSFVSCCHSLRLN